MVWSDAPNDPYLVHGDTTNSNAGYSTKLGALATVGVRWRWPRTALILWD